MEDFSLAPYDNRDEYIQSPGMAIRAKGFGTTISALLLPDLGEIIIGSDTNTTTYLNHVIIRTGTTAQKIFMIGTRVIMGICGYIHFTDRLVDWLRNVGYATDLPMFDILQRIRSGIQSFRTVYLNDFGDDDEDIVSMFDAVIGVVAMEDSGPRVPSLRLYQLSGETLSLNEISNFVAIGTGYGFAEAELRLGYEKVSSTEDALELCMRSLFRATFYQHKAGFFPVYRFRCPASGSNRPRLQSFLGFPQHLEVIYGDIVTDRNPDANNILVQTVQARNIRRNRAIGMRVHSDDVATLFSRLLYPMIEASIFLEDEL